MIPHMEALPAYFTGIIAVLLLSAFVKIVTTLSILRYGIGLHGSGFGFVIIGVSFALALLVMTPHIQTAGGLVAVLFSRSNQQVSTLEKKFRPFLEQHTDQKISKRFMGLADKLSGDEVSGKEKEAAATEKLPFAVLVSSFLVSELQEAFQIGFLILIPFIVVDLLITNILLALGVTQISHAVVALPLKILLFFVIDGWALISEKLIMGYVNG